MDCVFCESQDIKERMIVKNDHAFAFPTNIPITPGHVLICPLRCVAHFAELTSEEVTAIFSLMQDVQVALVQAFSVEGFNIAWNQGGVAGQSVPHFHLHVVPRKKGDVGVLGYEPRSFLYRPGSREEMEEEELRKIALLVKNRLR